MLRQITLDMATGENVQPVPEFQETEGPAKFAIVKVAVVHKQRVLVYRVNLASLR